MSVGRQAASAYVTQDSRGCAWLTEKDELGVWRDSYLGRRVDPDRVRDLEDWSSEHGMPFYYTQEALAAARRTREGHSWRRRWSNAVRCPTQCPVRAKDYWRRAQVVRTRWKRD